MPTARKQPASPHENLERWLEQQAPKQVPVLRRARDRLASLFRDPQRCDVAWWYAVGQCVLTLFPPSDQRRGRGFMEMLGDVAEPGRDRSRKSVISFLYWARELAVKLGRAEVADLGRKVTTGTITVTHVLNLLAVDEKNNTHSRSWFLRECVKRQWGANQLKREIQGDKRSFASYGGRHAIVRTTTSPAVAARETVVRSTAWAACCRRHFLDRGAPLARPCRGSDPQLSRELVQALQAVSEVAALATQAKRVLKRVVSRMPAGGTPANRAGKHRSGRHR